MTEQYSNNQSLCLMYDLASEKLISFSEDAGSLTPAGLDPVHLFFKTDDIILMQIAAVVCWSS